MDETRQKPRCRQNRQIRYRCTPETRHPKPDTHHRAFSLVEIMVVLVIIGLLAGIVTVNVRGYLVRGKQDAARAQIASFRQALDTWYSVHHHYPSNEEGLNVLTQTSDKLPEPLLDKVPRDPWGNVYQYNRPGRSGSYEVICFGADGREGGDGGDGDITSDNLSGEQNGG